MIEFTVPVVSKMVNDEINNIIAQLNWIKNITSVQTGLNITMDFDKVQDSSIPGDLVNKVNFDQVIEQIKDQLNSIRPEYDKKEVYK
jgi:hypothetical protein